MAEIGYALSGGGYRAATFHLGTLHYMRHLKLADGRSLLDLVNSISTISGGTITGLWYMMNYAKGADMDKAFEDLFHKLRDDDVIGRGVDSLFAKGNPGASAILEMVKAYDEVFFNEETFSCILDSIGKGNVHHFSANGTDFANAFAFRFQASPKNRSVIGNSEHRIPLAIARQVKLSEILAVSSCFPGGFEPMTWPDDFAFASKEENKEYVEGAERFQLMDGGIVDNQGLEPLLLADSSMAKGSDRKAHDLLIISDVKKPDIKSSQPVNIPLRNKLALSHLDIISDVLIAIGVGLCILFGLLGLDMAFGFSLCLTVLGVISRTASFVLKRILVRTIKEVSPVPLDGKKVWSYPIMKIATLAGNRLGSLMQMSTVIFMKSIHQLRYKSVYEDKGWDNRRINNAIYEMTTEYGAWVGKVKNGNYPEDLVPSEAMQKNSLAATNMATTLWFTDEDRKAKTPEALFSCGQYNICMNLLEYIWKLRRDSSNTTLESDPDNPEGAHQLILSLEKQLREDWEKFQKDPMFMVIK